MIDLAIIIIVIIITVSCAYAANHAVQPNHCTTSTFGLACQQYITLLAMAISSHC